MTNWRNFHGTELSLFLMPNSILFCIHWSTNTIKQPATQLLLNSISIHTRTAQLQMHIYSYVQHTCNVRSDNQTPWSYFRKFPTVVLQSFRNIHKVAYVDHSFWIPSVVVFWQKSYQAISYSDHTPANGPINCWTSIPQHQECSMNKSCCHLTC